MIRQVINDLEKLILTEAAIKEFADSLRGELVLPSHHNYDIARKVWNGMIDKRPAMIVQCADIKDIINAVNFARTNNLLLAVRGGGHNVAGTATCNDGVVIDLSRLKRIQIEPARRRAQAQAGLTWGEFDRETQTFGLATTGGIISTTGIAGLTTGGGIGWLMGKCGLTCDNLISVDVVIADGTVLTANASENEDLFWGIRGGSGNFGIVTSFEYDLHPIGPVLGGLVLYPLAKAKEVLDFYRDYSRIAPDELTAYAVRLLAPDGTPGVGISICYCGPLEEAEQLLEPLRSLGAPLVNLIRPMSYCELQTSYDTTSPPGEHYYWKSTFLSELSDGAIDTAVAYLGGGPSPHSKLFIEHLHGAVSRVANEETAFSHRTAKYHFAVLSRWDREAEYPDAQIQWTYDFWKAMQPFSTGGAYINALGIEREEQIKSAYGMSYDRLVSLKNKYDPTNFFSLNQNVKPSLQP